MFGFGKKHYNLPKEEANSDKFYTGLFLGVIIGVGLYWLFKSENGKKVRQALLNSEEEWVQKAKELISETEFAELLEDSEEEQLEKTKLSPIRRTYQPPISSLPKKRFFRIKR